jgi:nucleoside-diphosphate-sugar epimerase
MLLHTIIGGYGTIGKKVAVELVKMNIPVRIASRNPRIINKDDEVAVVDVFNELSVQNGIRGTSVVYLILGLPYKSKIWLDGFPKAVQNVINACKKEGAKLVYFDNVYMYGCVDGWMNENSLNNPSSVKGKARHIAADLILDAVNKKELDAMICRSADFYGDYPNFDVIKQIALKLVNGKKAQLLISAEKKHSLTYIPDAAKAVAYLGQQNTAYNQIWHMPTDPNVLTGKELVGLIAEVLQVKPSYQVVPKGVLKFISFFNNPLRELLKLSYQWEKDYLFSSQKIEESYGIKATTYRNGIREHLRNIGIN